MRQRVVMGPLIGPMQPEHIEVEADGMMFGDEPKILAGLSHCHIGHAPAEARRATEIRPPHEVFRCRRPAGMLLHR